MRNVKAIIRLLEAVVERGNMKDEAIVLASTTQQPNITAGEIKMAVEELARLEQRIAASSAVARCIAGTDEVLEKLATHMAGKTVH